MPTKKYLGIFYKSWWLQFHYLPLAIVGVLLTQLTAHLFGFHDFHKWYIILTQFIIIFIGVSLTDQIIHAIGSLFGMKD